jgi:hypothetical protein
LLGHNNVGDDEVRLFAAEQRRAAYAILGAQDFVAVILLQELDDGVAHNGIVVYDQDLHHVLLRSALAAPPECDACATSPA